MATSNPRSGRFEVVFHEGYREETIVEGDSLDELVDRLAEKGGLDLADSEGVL